MKNHVMQRYFKQAVIALVLALVGASLGGCVYFNTFYNAKKAFNRAEDARKKAEAEGRPGGNSAGYRTAIDKSLKVVEEHPNSKYYDDALYVLGISYYYTSQYAKAERRFREILTNYSESKYARDSRLYLAKSKLQQREVADAMEMFQELFVSDVNRDFKAEAAIALGEYYFADDKIDTATLYFRSVRDSLGNDFEKRRAQMFIADGHFKRFRFKEALGAYLQVLGMNPDTDQRYHALFRAGISSYRLQRIDDGLAYLNELLEDERYYDSSSVIKLSLGKGYELDADLIPAEGIYEEVAKNELNRPAAAEANYRLALIYQYEYDELEKAKEYYDKVVSLYGGSDIGKDALQRSTDIGKLEEYKVAFEVDSTTTQADIDEAAYIQYQLAELYWFKLNKPDTAILEMQYVVDSFPNSYEAPKAMIALSEMKREHEGDSVAADSILRAMLDIYPNTDFAGEAIQRLGLENTPADTGYARRYLDKAESFLIDEDQPDSARYYYQYIVDNFPNSKFYLQARFSLIWLQERYDPPGDSTVYFAYEEFADSFPNSSWAREARNRLTVSAPVRAEPNEIDREPLDETAPGRRSQAGGETLGDSESDAAEAEDFNIYSGLYISPEGDSIIDLHDYIDIEEEREPFIYPEEAYRYQFEGQIEMYFQIKLDSFGEVVDLRLVRPSPNRAINEEATKNVRSMRFNVIRLEQHEQDKWWVYKYTVERPKDLGR